MRVSSKTDLVLGLLVAAASVAILVLWIPNDIASGIVDKVRRRVVIGDAFAPTLATVLFALGGLLLAVEALRKASSDRLSRENLIYIPGLVLLFLLTTLLFRWTGPALVALLGPDGADYRALRDTVPWKYSGFLLGGTFLVTALISFAERRLRWRSILIGVIASLVLIALYDLPFDHLVLPPNGDV